MLFKEYKLEFSFFEIIKLFLKLFIVLILNILDG